MADIEFNVAGAAKKKLIDMGDGSHAERVVATTGIGATDLGKAEDSAHTTGSTGVVMLGIRTPVAPVAQTSADGDYGALALDQFGDVKTLLVDSAGVPLTPTPLGRAAAASSTPVALSTEDLRSLRPNANYRLLSAAATTNGALVSATARNVFKLMGRVVRASSVFIKVYDKANAPTVGTDVPIATFECVASSTFNLDLSGLALVNGLGIAMTSAAADADVGALLAGDVTALNLSYAV